MQTNDPVSKLKKDVRRLSREVKRLTFDISQASKQTPLLRALVEGAPDAMAIVDPDGIILEHNSALNELVGKPHLMTNESISDLFHSRGPNADRSHRISLMTPSALRKASKNPLSLYGFCQQKPVEIHLSPFTGNERIQIVMVIRELHDHKRQMRELHRAQATVSELNEKLRHTREIERRVRQDSLALLAGTLAHDLNNALSVVRGNLELIRLETHEGELQTMLEDMAEGCNGIAALAQRLRTFSSGPSLLLSPIDLNRWVPEALSHLKGTLRISTDVAVAPHSCWVNADDGQLHQVLLNIITNSVQAGATHIQLEISTQPNGLQTGVTVGQASAYPNQPHVCCRITDNGTGIPQEILESVFEPFFSTKPTGGGLGLASVSSIIAAHSGGVLIEASSKKGCVFNLVFPSISGPEKSTSPDNKSASLNDQHILVLEDEDRVRNVLRRHLELAGATVTAESTAHAAVASYSRLRDLGLVPICVFDLLIENGDGGVEALAEIQRKWPDVRAIACSGHSEVDIRTSFPSLGFSSYISKPFTQAGLTQAIASVSKGTDRPS